MYFKVCRESNLDYTVQRCQITEIVFYTKNGAGKSQFGPLERILDFAGVTLDRFDFIQLQTSHPVEHSAM